MPWRLLDWWLGKEAPSTATKQTDSSAPTTPANSSSNDTSPTPQASQGQQVLTGSVPGNELEQIQALKRQLEALEARLTPDSPNQESTTTTIPSSYQRNLSPMQQRRLERPTQQTKDQDNSEASSALTPSPLLASLRHLLSKSGWFAGETAKKKMDSLTSPPTGEEGGVHRASVKEKDGTTNHV